MAHVSTFGNVPIIDKQYGVSPSSSLISSGWTYLNTWIQAHPDDYVSLIMAHGRDWGVVNVDSWSIGRRIAEVTLFPTDPSKPTTAYHIACTGKHSAFGTDVADFSILANSNIGLNSDTALGSCAGGNHFYTFGIALYTDQDGQDLNSVCIYMCTIQQTTPPSIQDWIDSSFSYNRLSITALNALDYDAMLYEGDDEYGEDNEPEGYGQGEGITPTFDHSSDIIPVPEDPIVSSQDIGFYHIYKVSSGALATLGQYLFPSAQNITDVVSALRAIAGIFGYRDSVQYIVDLHSLPVEPNVGASDYIKIGALSTDISQPVVSSDYVTFDCGSISVGECYANYVDYLTRARLYLPFVGFIDLKPELWASGILQVKYKFNVIDGSFMAYVVSSSSKSKLYNTVVGQFGGSASIHMPVIANSYGALASGLVSGSMAIAAGAATGNPGAALSGITAAMNAQPPLQTSNNFNSSTSFLGVRRPYLLLERPVPAFAAGYPHDAGLPLNVTMTISGIHGYTEIADIDLSGIGATQDELDELRTILASGVYL